MYTPERSKSPLKSNSLRRKSLKLHSVGYLKLNKTMGLIPARSENRGNITQFVFDEYKKRNEIGRIIDNYFEEDDFKLRIKENKSISLMDFVKMDHITRKRHSLKTKLNLQLDIGDTGKINSLQTTMLHQTHKILPPIFEEQPQTPSKFNVLLMKTIRKSPLLSKSSKTSQRSKSISVRNIQSNDRFSITDNKSIKKCYTLQGMNYLYLQLRSYHILRQFGVESIYSYKDKNQLEYKFYLPLRQLLYNISEQQINSELAYLITPLPFYFQLFNNNCELLLHLIKSIILDLVKIKGRLINNNINLSNIHFERESLVIDSWATATIKEPKIERVLHPILRNNKQWFVILEYLPPEMLESIVSGNNYDMFEYPSSIDMWSIGSLILEILTLIPLNASHKFFLSHNTKVKRRGLYFGRINDIPNLIKRQKKLCSRFKYQIDKLGQISFDLNPKILQLTSKMLKINPAQRLTPEQGLNIIMKN